MQVLAQATRTRERPVYGRREENVYKCRRLEPGEWIWETLSGHLILWKLLVEHNSERFKTHSVVQYKLLWYLNNEQVLPKPSYNIHGYDKSRISMRGGRKNWMSIHFMQHLQSRVHSLVPNVSAKREFPAQTNRLILNKSNSFVRQECLFEVNQARPWTLIFTQFLPECTELPKNYYFTTKVNNLVKTLLIVSSYSIKLPGLGLESWASILYSV